LLHMRGQLVLHASAVNMRGSGVLFVGDKHAGKSSIAAAAVAAGHSLVSDDLGVLDLSGETPIMQPAFPRLRLWKEAGGILPAAIRETATELHPALQKYQYDLRSAFSSTNVPPAIILVLERGRDPGLEVFPTAESLGFLLRFAYLAKHLSRGLSLDGGQRHFELCCLAANRLKVARLAVPPGLDRLVEAVRLVEEALSSARGIPNG